MMQELYKSFIKFQSEFKGLKPDAENPYFKSRYITLDGILETTRPILTSNGLSIIQNAFSDDVGYMCVKTILIHESGQSLETEIMKMKPQKDDAQQRGSLITYMKRYQLGALLGICESVDDDANVATYGVTKKSNKTKGKQSLDKINRLISIARNVGVDEFELDSAIRNHFNKEIKDLTDEEYEIACKGYQRK